MGVRLKSPPWGWRAVCGRKRKFQGRAEERKADGYPTQFRTWRRATSNPGWLVNEPKKISHRAAACALLWIMVTMCALLLS